MTTNNPLPSEAVRAHLDQVRLLVDADLERLLPSVEEYPETIHKAMRYSVFAGGKRLRPALCLEAGRLFGGDEPGLLRLGSALELIHTYSLIHDDLPALDNDDLRRGRPTSHCVFGEATAILAGDALLTLAFEVLSNSSRRAPEAKLRLIHDLAHAIGTRGGMVGGQIIDLEMTGQTADAATVDYIHSAKTGSFLCAAVRCGAIYAGASEEDLGRLTTYGKKVGLAFQIVDDLLDVLGSQEQMGKTLGKDVEQHKATYPAVHGIEPSKQAARRLIEEGCAALDPYGEGAQTLVGIAQYLVVRTS